MSYSRALSAAELAYVREGHFPREVDDKWFCFVEDDRLRMHDDAAAIELFDQLVSGLAAGWS